MKEIRKPLIRLLTECSQTAALWTEVLQASLFEVTSCATPQPDIIITDQAVSGLDQLDQSEPDSTPGLIRIGQSGPADVHLPSDATPRELKLACTLLAKIVHLNRQLRSNMEIRRQLSLQALTDTVTGLANRRAWDKTLGLQLDSENRPELLCIAIIDLDHFKKINDAYGYTEGDAVLRSAADAISHSIRQNENDFVARLGGDEFGLILSVPDRAAGLDIIERVRKGLTAHLAESAKHTLTASAGIACISDIQNTTATSLFTAANIAMRKAKEQGRDQTVLN